MNDLRFFRLELAILLGVYLLFVQYRTRIWCLPAALRSVHLGMTLVFAEIGVIGMRTLINLCAGHSKFTATFREPNLLNLPSSIMHWLAIVHGFVAFAFFLSVMYLGEMRENGRRWFLRLVLPTTAFYPVVMASFIGCVDELKSSGIGAALIVGSFAGLAVVGIWFYNLDSVVAAIRGKAGSGTTQSDQK